MYSELPQSKPVHPPSFSVSFMAQASQKHSTSQLHSIQEVDESIFADGFSVVSDSQRTTTDTSTTWGPGTLSGRALLAVGEATIRGIDALLIRRRLATIRLRAPSLTGPMYNDLLELCRPAMYSIRITKQALDLTLAQICAGPESSVYMLVLFLCKWPQQEARLILLELARSLPDATPPGWNLTRFYDFMVAIIQVQDEWRSFVIEAALLLDNTNPAVISHPIHLLYTGSTTNLSAASLAGLQEAHFARLRSKAWILLQQCGLPEMWLSFYSSRMSSQPALDRMLQIESIISQIVDPYVSSQMPTTSQVFGALVDSIIFLSEIFRSDVRSGAAKCLLEYWIYCWKWKQWEFLHQVFSLFDSFHIQMQIFMILRDRLPVAKLADFIQAYPKDPAHYSDAFHLLSEWILGLGDEPKCFTNGL
ncbi:hypothetical protein MVEN_00365800 [Mycena venus]|uniref:Uncharacterized protein n=1 Tax=Mycena venus TaxID=2733690 RepID=A0A8H6YPN9_9AGAR|nr:hypothetical protein MVEN_00365800 [Mycena venus]